MDLLVNIDVDDLDRASRFYTEAFGLRCGRRLGTAAIELLGGPVPIYLLQQPAGSPASAGTAQLRDYRRHWTPVHLDLVVDDLNAQLSRALAAGAILERPVESHDWGRLAAMADPFGHGFCLLQFSAQGYDALAVTD